jgi:hypothetical protein
MAYDCAYVLISWIYCAFVCLSPSLLNRQNASSREKLFNMNTGTDAIACSPNPAFQNRH